MTSEAPSCPRARSHHALPQPSWQLARGDSAWWSAGSGVSIGAVPGPGASALPLALSPEHVRPRLLGSGQMQTAARATEEGWGLQESPRKQVRSSAPRQPTPQRCGTPPRKIPGRKRRGLYSSGSRDEGQGHVPSRRGSPAVFRGGTHPRCGNPAAAGLLWGHKSRRSL